MSKGLLSVSKIGRNDYCPCGSQKKFKKCCLSRGIIVPAKNTSINPPEKMLVKTLTDEFFQPIRLYYIVHNKDKLEACFRCLRCMKYEEELDNWIIQYSDETAQIGLNVPPKKVPKEAQPLVIATIYIENETTMLIDVRSIERAKKLVEFIDTHVSREIVEITHAAIYNQLITVSESNHESVMDVNYDDIFDQKNITVIDPAKTLHESKEISAQYDTPKEKLQAIIQKTEDDSKKPLPKVEKFPIHFYEDGIEAFAGSCQMRQMIAMKHYLGNENYSFYDLMQETIYKNLNKF